MTKLSNRSYKNLQLSRTRKVKTESSPHELPISVSLLPVMMPYHVTEIISQNLRGPDTSNNKIQSETSTPKLCPRVGPYKSKEIKESQENMKDETPSIAHSIQTPIPSIEIVESVNFILKPAVVPEENDYKGITLPIETPCMVPMQSMSQSNSNFEPNPKYKPKIMEELQLIRNIAKSKVPLNRTINKNQVKKSIEKSVVKCSELAATIKNNLIDNNNKPTPMANNTPAHFNPVEVSSPKLTEVIVPSKPIEEKFPADELAIAPTPDTHVTPTSSVQLTNNYNNVQPTPIFKQGNMCIYQTEMLDHATQKKYFVTRYISTIVTPQESTPKLSPNN